MERWKQPTVLIADLERLARKVLAPFKDCLALSRIIELYDHEGACPEVLLLGDSVTLQISRTDGDRRCLGDMFTEGVNNKGSAAYVARSAYHSGVYYMLVRTLEVLKQHPRALIIPINLRSFSPQWDLNPTFQCVPDITKMKKYIVRRSAGATEFTLFDVDKENSFARFYNTEVAYPGTNLRYLRQFLDVAQRKAEYDKEERYKQLFIYHYMHAFPANHRKLALLRMTLELAIKLDLEVVVYVTPINHIAGTKYVGEAFLNMHRLNVGTIRGVLGPGSGRPLIIEDLSCLLSPQHFMHEDDPTEHLNQHGRSILVNKLIELISD